MPSSLLKGINLTENHRDAKVLNVTGKDIVECGLYCHRNGGAHKDKLLPILLLAGVLSGRLLNSAHSTTCSLPLLVKMH